MDVTVAVVSGVCTIATSVSGTVSSAAGTVTDVACAMATADSGTVMVAAHTVADVCP